MIVMHVNVRWPSGTSLSGWLVRRKVRRDGTFHEIKRWRVGPIWQMRSDCNPVPRFSSTNAPGVSLVAFCPACYPNPVPPPACRDQLFGPHGLPAGTSKAMVRRILEKGHGSASFAPGKR